MVIRVFLSLVVLTSISFVSNSPYADDAIKCDGTGIYRPFTPKRKFQIAAAYLVNPELLEKAKVIKGYSLSAIINSAEISKKYKWTGSINASIWLPIANAKGEFLWTTLSFNCILPEGKKYLSISKAVDKVISTFGGEIYVTLDPKAEKLVMGSVKSKKFVAWNPKEKVTSNDISPALKGYIGTNRSEK